jgi:hypothetical protein
MQYLCLKYEGATVQNLVAERPGASDLCTPSYKVRIKSLATVQNFGVIFHNFKIFKKVNKYL